MKYTLIEMVQDILSSMDSDSVNSIGDTIESMQVATIIKNTYNDLTSVIEFPEQYTLFQLDPSLDSLKPTVMYLPATVENIEWLKYNKIGSTSDVSTSPSWTTPDGLVIWFGTAEATQDSSSTGGNYQQFRDIKYLNRKEFLTIIQSMNNTESNVVDYNLLVEGVNIPLLCRNDKQPEYYTDFENRTIVFDSFDSSVESTMQSSKTMAYGKRTRTFQMVDTFVPALDDKYTTILFNEAKSLAFSELKQLTNTKAEKSARRGWIKSQSAKDSIPYGWNETNKLPNYGRRK